MWYENLCLQIGEGVSYSDSCYKVQQVLIQRGGTSRLEGFDHCHAIPDL